jgi:pimeloyl-ACP methyl ester carboxylesterase
LACAALAPNRFRAALVAAGVAPYDAEGLDFLEGMGEANVIEFTATLEGEATLRPLLEEQASAFRVGTVADVVSSWQTMLPAVDQAVLSGELADDFMASLQHGLASTVEGWIDDDIAFTSPWGFDLGDVRIPTTLWHGGEDLMVPFSHGEWLSEHIPNARVHLDPNEGHMSVRVARMPAMLDELLSLA